MASGGTGLSVDERAQLSAVNTFQKKPPLNRTLNLTSRMRFCRDEAKGDTEMQCEEAREEVWRARRPGRKCGSGGAVWGLQVCPPGPGLPGVFRCGVGVEEGEA